MLCWTALHRIETHIAFVADFKERFIIVSKIRFCLVGTQSRLVTDFPIKRFEDQRAENSLCSRAFPGRIINSSNFFKRFVLSRALSRHRSNLQRTLHGLRLLKRVKTFDNSKNPFSTYGKQHFVAVTKSVIISKHC